MDRLLGMLIQDYLAGEMPLERLQSRLIDITWGEVDDASPETLALAAAIDSVTAEFTSSHISEVALKNRIRELAGLNSLIVTTGEASAAASPRWGSESPTQRRKVALG